MQRGDRLAIAPFQPRTIELEWPDYNTAVSGVEDEPDVFERDDTVFRMNAGGLARWRGGLATAERRSRRSADEAASLGQVPGSRFPHGVDNNLAIEEQLFLFKANHHGAVYPCALT